MLIRATAEERREWQARLQGSSTIEVCFEHHRLMESAPTRVIPLLQLVVNDLLQAIGRSVRVVELRSMSPHRCGRYPYSLPEELWDRLLESRELSSHAGQGRDG